MQTFRIGNTWILLARVAAWGNTVLAPFLVLGLYLALTKPIVERLKTTQLAILFETGLFLTTALITIFGAWYCFRYLRDFSFRSVTVDDGIWLTHLSKLTGLIHWKDIVCIRERDWWYRLDLKDHEGVTLIKLEYELADFNKLYSIVEENT